ncbi:MAG: divalent-cation tolerance protein CutA [Chthoniobacterales bacterium]|nr:divalent-cation tolerance protein CutA [Chthoniobacterales bacterium]
METHGGPDRPPRRTFFPRQKNRGQARVMVLLVLSTFPDADTAASVAKTLVEENLAACGTLVPGARSIYRWEGEIEDAAEVLVLFKTSGPAYAKLEKRLLKLHPHENPEIIAFEAGAASKAYAAWVAAGTTVS